VRTSGHFGPWALLLAALVALAPIGQAFAACDPAAPKRTIELSPGDHVGGSDKGFKSAGLRAHEVILTFDDGPNPETTPLILDTLEANCIHATFFLIGPAASAFPDLVRRQLSSGHSVGGHTWSHEPLTNKSIVTAIADITRGFRPLTAVDVPPNLFRFPGMSSSPELLDWLRRHGMAAVGADIDVGVGSSARAEDVLARIKTELKKKGRGIILLKDSEPSTVKLLPGLIEFLRRERYTIVRLKPANPAGAFGG
jgi:peptidoglycan/xylan/chitin deacetylase (PgdA/CDA1 family)